MEMKLLLMAVCDGQDFAEKVAPITEGLLEISCQSTVTHVSGTIIGNTQTRQAQAKIAQDCGCKPEIAFMTQEI
jgi:hypothetical protein